MNYLLEFRRRVARAAPFSFSRLHQVGALARWSGIDNPLPDEPLDGAPCDRAIDSDR